MKNSILIKKDILESVIKTLNGVMGTNKGTDVKDNVARLDVGSSTLGTVRAHAKKGVSSIVELAIPLLDGVAGQTAYINVYALNKVIKHLDGEVLTLNTEEQTIGDNFTTIPLVDLTDESNGYFREIYTLPGLDSKISRELIALDSEKMLEVLGRFSILTANDDLRPVMNGVCFFNNNAKELFVAASNGYFIGAEKLLIAEEDNNVESNVIIYSGDIDTILKAFNCGQSLIITLTQINRDAIQVSDGINSVYFRPIDGSYPNVHAVIPTAQAPFKITVKMDVFSKALAIERGIAFDPKQCSVIISEAGLDGAKCYSNLAFRGGAEATTILEGASIDNRGMEPIAISAHVCDVLFKAMNFGLKKKEIAESVIKIGITDPGRVLMFDNGSGIKYGLMPVVIKQE